jgi:hypothetical protein
MIKWTEWLSAIREQEFVLGNRVTMEFERYRSRSVFSNEGGQQVEIKAKLDDEWIAVARIIYTFTSSGTSVELVSIGDNRATKALKWTFKALEKGVIETKEHWVSYRPFNCKRCGRPIRDIKYLTSGIGPYCASLGGLTI